MRERNRAEGQKLDQLAARARATGDTLVLEALGEVSKAIREQNVQAARSVAVAPSETKAQRQARITKERDAAAKEMFHKLHTALLAPARREPRGIRPMQPYDDYQTLSTAFFCLIGGIVLACSIGALAWAVEPYFILVMEALCL